jgi:hypothetical protein
MTFCSWIFFLGPAFPMFLFCVGRILQVPNDDFLPQESGGNSVCDSDGWKPIDKAHAAETGFLFPAPLDLMT